MVKDCCTGKFRIDMEIYYTKIDFITEQRLEALQNLLPEARQEKIAQYRTEDKKRSIAAGLLLEYGCNCHGFSLREDRKQRGLLSSDYSHDEENRVLQKISVETGEHGKPYFILSKDLFYRTKKPAVYDIRFFNLSHAGDYAAAVFDSQPVGIDIENKERGDSGERVAKRFFLPEEQRVCAAEAEKFTWIWTRKEAYLKALGTGLTMSTKSFSVLKDFMEQFYLQTFSIGKEFTGTYPQEERELAEEYWLSVCSRKEITARPRRVTWQEMSRVLDC